MPKLNSSQRVSVGIITDSNSPTVAATFDTSPWEDAAFLITVRVSARQINDATAVSGHMQTGIFYRADNVLALSGAMVDQFSEGEGWVVGVTAVGDNISIAVSGHATEEVKWLVEADIQVNDDAPIKADNT